MPFALHEVEDWPVVRGWQKAKVYAMTMYERYLWCICMTLILQSCMKLNYIALHGELA